MYANCFQGILKFICALLVLVFFAVPKTVLGNALPVITANPNAAFLNADVSLQQGLPLLFEYHRLTTGNERQRFAYPQRNYCYRTLPKRWISSADGLQYGLEGNFYAGVTAVPSGYAGISTAGYIDSLDFDFNAALFVEKDDENSAFDRQETGWVLWDNEGRAIINYKRMQAHIGLNYAWLRLEMGHDALHWGPGFYNNLTLNRQAIPYKYFSINLTFGPLRVISFYSPLEIDSVGSKIHSDGRRHLYGHRYEVAIGNATLGMSEIQVIYNENNPWLLAPVYPLFMEKGNYTERNNNGALAFDANYRLFRLARVYGEFYLEDLDSPIAVVENEYLNSQWALMLGIQISHDFVIGHQKIELGSVFEYARIDQRVYTHYEPNEAQIANAGFPLGNQLGPNSQSIDWMVYSRLNEALFVGLRNNWSWKGDVYGSDINCKWEPGKNKKKDFLGGAKMKYSMTSTIAYNSTYWGCSGAITLFNESRGEFNVSVRI